MTMSREKVRVLAANVPAQYDEWSQIYSSWSSAEVYAHPNYVRLYADGQTQAMCAVLESHNGSVLFPFLLRSIDAEAFPASVKEDAFDLTTPYGYGGPFFWNGNRPKALAEQFWTEFDRWSENNNVVSEFVRFSLFDESLLAYPGVTEFKQDNIVRSLALSEEELWMDFDHKVRKNVKKAIRMGVQVETDLIGERFEEFYRIYGDTMDRREASDSYYFTREYFETINRELQGSFAYFHAMHEDKVISTELVLASKRAVYSFLGGTDSEFFSLRPNDLLKFEIMKWARATDRISFVLGGGYESGDGISRYKQSFAPNGSMPFSVGSRILDPLLYQQLVKERADQDSQWAPSPGFFPAYRS